MRDQHVGQIALLLQGNQQIEDLRLDGNIQRAGGFIQHDDVRIRRERPGNGDALTLAAGKRMRQTVKIFRSNAHLLRQRLSQLATLPFAAALLDPHRLGDDAPDG